MLRIISSYYCEKCNKEFKYKEECERHEADCQVKKEFICDKCGKVIEWDYGKRHEDKSFQKCWWFAPSNRYRAGYGSKFDGQIVKFKVCDDCLFEFVESFKSKSF